MYGDKKSSSKTGKGRQLFVLFAWGFVLIVVAAIALGDIGQGQMFAQADEGLDAAIVEVSSSEANASVGGTLQSIKFNKDEGIKEALRILSALYQKNIVPSPTVDGILGFTTLKDVTFEEAMGAILGSNFVYEQEGNLIRVYTKDEYKKIKEDSGRMIHKIFTLYYITAEEAAKLITPVLSDTAKIVKSTAAENSISGGSGTSTSGAASSSSSGGGGGDKMALNDTIVLYDYPENMEKAGDVINSIDIRPKQVLVEATILSAVLTEDTKFGIDWNFLAGVSLAGTAATGGTLDTVKGGYVSGSQTSGLTPIGQIAAGVAGAPIETTGFATSGIGGLRIGATSGNMAVFITALEAITDVTILANPKILAVNKQEGYVHIGKTLGYRGSTAISTGGVATQGEVQFLDTGTVLTFRPYIGNDGYIRMDISPSDSTAQLNVDKVPDKTTAEVKTNIIVKDGQTIVIGGLFRDVVTTVRSQVPVLGNLPFAGALFRGTNDRTERQEVMVLLTPHIIEDPNETEGQARANDVSRKRSAAMDELQWMDRAKIAKDYYAKAVTYYMDGDSVSAMRELRIVLQLNPSYLEAIRLKERIIAETSPDEVEKLERIMLEKIDQREAPNWQRR